MSDPVFIELLDRALEWLRADLREIVEVECVPDMSSGEFFPRAGSADPISLGVRRAVDLMTLVRDIELVTGRFAEHPEPQWLDDLIDGKWSLT